MAEITVDIKAEDINKAVADAIIKSVLGEQIVKSVNEFVDQMVRSSYGNPLKTVIEATVKEEITKLVIQRLPEIKEILAKQLADGTIDNIAIAAVQKFSKAIY